MKGCVLAVAFAVLGMMSAHATERADIVFVLGSDIEEGRTFYTPAERYFAQHLPRDSTPLVTVARSLQEVREWLARSPARGARPWGRITLVAHGSPWVGLAIPLYQGGRQPATASALATALDHGEFPALADTVVDGETEIALDSCGLGRRPDLLKLYARLFGGDDAQQPRLLATSAWIEFGAASDDQRTIATWRRERPFAARVVPGDAWRDDTQTAVRRALDRQLRETGATADDLTATRWQVSPLRIEVVLADTALCRSDRDTDKLTRQPAVQRALHDHALRRAELHWRVEARGETCRLLGSALLATLSTGQLPESALP